MSQKTRHLAQRDWDQLLIIASGYLPSTGGDLVAAMAKAIVAHATLIEAVRSGGVVAQLPRGEAVLQAQEDGGLTIVYASKGVE